MLPLKSKQNFKNWDRNWLEYGQYYLVAKNGKKLRTI